MGPHQQANRERGRPAYPAKGRGELMDLRLPLGITLWQLTSCGAVAASRALSRAASPRASQEAKEMGESLGNATVGSGAQGTGGKVCSCFSPCLGVEKKVVFLPRLAVCKGILPNFPSCTLCPPHGWYLCQGKHLLLLCFCRVQHCKVQISNVVSVCNVNITC